MPTKAELKKAVSETLTKQTRREEESIKTVAMVREGETADVHPDEVENWSQYGWSVK